MAHLFLSTLSLRRATRGAANCYLDNIISIHALLAESDFFLFMVYSMFVYFYPRSPCGERRRGGVACYLDNIISIHALLAESDCACRSGWLLAPYFYPRSPCGERPIVQNIIFMPRKFLSTLSLRRATFSGTAWVQDFPISIHALLAESDDRNIS